MYQQYIYGVANCFPLVVYELHNLCCYIFEYKNIFEYKIIFYRRMGWVNQHPMEIVVLR